MDIETIEEYRRLDAEYREAKAKVARLSAKRPGLRALLKRMNVDPDNLPSCEYVEKVMAPTHIITPPAPAPIPAQPVAQPIRAVFRATRADRPRPSLAAVTPEEHPTDEELAMWEITSNNPTE